MGLWVVQRLIDGFNKSLRSFFKNFKEILNSQEVIKESSEYVIDNIFEQILGGLESSYAAFTHIAMNDVFNKTEITTVLYEESADQDTAEEASFYIQKWQSLKSNNEFLTQSIQNLSLALEEISLMNRDLPSLSSLEEELLSIL